MSGDCRARERWPARFAGDRALRGGGAVQWRGAPAEGGIAPDIRGAPRPSSRRGQSASDRPQSLPPPYLQPERQRSGFRLPPSAGDRRAIEGRPEGMPATPARAQSLDDAPTPARRSAYRTAKTPTSRSICGGLGVAGNLREALRWRGAPAEGGAEAISDAAGGARAEPAASVCGG